jgi:hypothetical protein
VGQTYTRLSTSLFPANMRATSFDSHRCAERASQRHRRYAEARCASPILHQRPIQLLVRRSWKTTPSSRSATFSLSHYWPHPDRRSCLNVPQAISSSPAASHTNLEHFGSLPTASSTARPTPPPTHSSTPPPSLPTSGPWDPPSLSRRLPQTAAHQTASRARRLGTATSREGRALLAAQEGVVPAGSL